LIHKDLLDREIAVEVELLRRKADEAPATAEIARDVVPEDADLASLKGRKADDRVDGRRLAGAVGAEKAEELTW